ncbi:hypothetical protein O6H91_Y544100 [Diphasiastrum complanatum]|nr:hypothetical protein O6H91_Y544100 [Diphasiastrum complanatum]
MGNFPSFSSRLPHIAQQNSHKRHIRRAVTIAERKSFPYGVEGFSVVAESLLRSNSCDFVGQERTVIWVGKNASLIELSDSSSDISSDAREPCSEAPELQLTMMAFRVAVLEKIATGLGVMAFVWATVVLLGGYAEMLELSHR